MLCPSPQWDGLILGFGQDVGSTHSNWGGGGILSNVAEPTKKRCPFSMATGQLRLHRAFRAVSSARNVQALSLEFLPSPQLRSEAFLRGRFFAGFFGRGLLVSVGVFHVMSQVERREASFTLRNGSRTPKVLAKGTERKPFSESPIWRDAKVSHLLKIRIRVSEGY